MLQATSEAIRPWRVTIWKALLALMLLLIISAMMIPNLLRSRMAADHASQYAHMHNFNGKAEAASPQGGLDRMVVRTGSMELVVQSPADTLATLAGLTQRMGGYVANSSLVGGDRNQTGSLTVRLPAARLDDFRAEIHKLGLHIESDHVESKEVTDQYVDMESTLRNFRAEEAQYLKIMERSGSIKDTLSVAERLADARGRIERLQGQLNLLSKQIEMATLTINLRAELPPPVTGVRWHPLEQARLTLSHAAEDMVEYADFMIEVLLRLPIYLLWLVTFFMGGYYGWRTARWMWRKMAPRPAEAS